MITISNNRADDGGALYIITKTVMLHFKDPPQL